MTLESLVTATDRANLMEQQRSQVVGEMRDTAALVLEKQGPRRFSFWNLGSVAWVIGTMNLLDLFTGRKLNKEIMGFGGEVTEEVTLSSLRGNVRNSESVSVEIKNRVMVELFPYNSRIYVYNPGSVKPFGGAKWISSRPTTVEELQTCHQLLKSLL